MKRPFICVRDTVVFPKATQGLFIGREITIKSINLSESEFNGEIVLLTQKRFEQANPKSIKDIFRVGTLCKMVGVVRLQDGTVRARFEGIDRFKVSKIDFSSERPLVTGETILEKKKKASTTKLSDEKKRIFTELFIQAKPYLVFDEDTTFLKDIKKAKSEAELSSIIQNHLKYSNPATPKSFSVKFRKRMTMQTNVRTHLQQQILEASNSSERLEKLQKYLIDEIKYSISGF